VRGALLILLAPAWAMAQLFPFPGPVPASGGSSGPALVSSTVCTPNSLTCVNSINTTGANAIYVVLGCTSPAGVSVTDNKGNTYVQAVGYNYTVGISLFYADNGTGSITTGTGHTFSQAGCSFAGWGAAAFSGINTTSSLDPAQSQNSASSGMTIHPGSINPGSGNHAVFLALGSYVAAGTWLVTSPAMANIVHQAGAPGTNYGADLWWTAQSPGAAVNPLATFSTTITNAGAAILSFGTP
jgi:hypothetical protein